MPLCGGSYALVKTVSMPYEISDLIPCVPSPPSCHMVVSATIDAQNNHILTILRLALQSLHITFHRLENRSIIGHFFADEDYDDANWRSGCVSPGIRMVVL